MGGKGQTHANSLSYGHMQMHTRTQTCARAIHACTQARVFLYGTSSSLGRFQLWCTACTCTLHHTYVCELHYTTLHYSAVQWQREIKQVRVNVCECVHLHIQHCVLGTCTVCGFVCMKVPRHVWVHAGSVHTRIDVSPLYSGKVRFELSNKTWNYFGYLRIF